MKVFVDELPKEPRECIFSKPTYHPTFGRYYVCNLRPIIKTPAGKEMKPQCICKSVDNCDLLLKLHSEKK